MKVGPRDDMRRLAHDVHIQVLLLHWAVHRLAERQSTPGDHGIEKVEEDFVSYCEQNKQALDFRLDRGLSLIGVVYFLIVSSMEVASRLDAQDKKIVEDEVEKSIGGYDIVKNSVTITSMQPLKSGDSVSTWTLVKRLRNSLSHARYEYVPESGMVQFEDFWNAKKTAKFEMNAFCLYDFAYKFGVGFCRANQKINGKP